MRNLANALKLFEKNVSKFVANKLLQIRLV